MTGLVFGFTGQVATELRAQAPELIFLGRSEADLSDPAACAEAIESHQPDFVVNAAAYTAVDQAENDRETALAVNGNAPGAMARSAADMGIPFVHISTDYVFDGTGEQAWRPDHPINPVNFYGASKAEGETQIIASGAVYAILRASWVFSAHGANFVKTMLRLGEERDALNIVSDQVGGPTPARAIAAACLEIATQLKKDPNRAGIYHFSGAPATNWAAFAKTIFEHSGQMVSVTGIPSSEYPKPAKRPLNSCLNCSTTLQTFGLEQPDWQAELRLVLGALKG